MDHPLRVAFMAIALVGCGGGAQEPAPEPSAGGELAAAEPATAPDALPEGGQPAWPGRVGSGKRVDDPVQTCGPGDSYAFVAGEFRCPGGGNPLAGDPSAGAMARVGNVGANASGHIIDHYRVPCPTGPVDLYVDMYGCADFGAPPGR